MKAFHSSALRLSVGYIGLGLVALVLFAAPLWYAWRSTIDDSRAAFLQADAQRLAEVFRRQGPAALASLVTTRVGMQIANERLLLFADPHLKPLAGNIDAWPDQVPLMAGVYNLSLRLDGHAAVVVVLLHEQLPGGYHLLVGRDTSLYVPLERRFWYALLGAMVILSTFGALGGILIRRALMARIYLMRQTVSAIMLGDLTHRLPADSAGDELNTLSQTINGMLNQIEQLVHGVRNVSNAVAHDLRTPLAELRVRLEELSLMRPSAEYTFAEIEAAVSDVDRVISIFNALLRLAEIDSGMRRSGFVPVELGEVAASAVEFYQPAGEIKGVRLQVSRPDAAPVRGDPVLLAQAISNLIDNALKYTPAGGNILVSVVRRPDERIEVVVADSGPGIAKSDRGKVTQRFYRGDASRCTPGVGLGLSLVEAVARLHGSALELQDNYPGLRASMALVQDSRPIERPASAAPKHGSSSMNLSIYDVTVPPYVRALTALGAVLEKARLYAENEKIDPSVLLSMRLSPDMLPLSKQIQIASDNAKGAAARLAQVDAPKFEDNETTFAQFHERIEKTIAFLKGLQTKQFEGAAERPVTLKFPHRSLEFKSGLEYLTTFATPNVYFHCTTAYGLLRHAGVKIGKGDFLGS